MSELKNIFDFFIRQKTKLSLKNYSPKSQNVLDLIPPSEYDLSIIKTDITRQLCQENLYILDILDKYFRVYPKEDLKILDIGSKSWNYARGEYIFFNKHCHHLEMTGVELDAYRLCWNLYSRLEIAKYNIKYLPFTYYIADDFLNLDDKFDYITWFLPFITLNPHKKWGLPKKYFQPEKLLSHAHESLNEGGVIFIVNQGEAEFWLQKKMCEELEIPYKEIGLIESEYSLYKLPHYAMLVF